MTDDLRTRVALEIGLLLLAKIEAETAVQQLLREREQQARVQGDSEGGEDGNT